VTPPHEPDIPENYYTDHCGGLTFAADGNEHSKNPLRDPRLTLVEIQQRPHWFPQTMSATPMAL